MAVAGLGCAVSPKSPPTSPCWLPHPWLRFMLPWMIQHIEEAESLLGSDFWPYGLDGNRHNLETFLRYHHEQGLSPRLVSPEELFAVSLGARR